MSEPGSSALPLRELSGFTSNLEECEAALARAHRTLSSIVASMKRQLQDATLHRVLRDTVEATTHGGQVISVKIEADDDINIHNSLSQVEQVGSEVVSSEIPCLDPTSNEV